MPILSEEIVAAEEKYVNNPELIAKNVELLRKWLPTQPHLPEISDKMLYQILHSCYFDLETTKFVTENYYTMRTNMPELFTNRDIRRPELASVAETMNLVMLPGVDPRGYHFLYTGLCDYDPSKFVYLETNKLLFMVMEAYAAKHGPLQGMVVIHDMKGAKLGHLARVSLSWMKKCLVYNQDASLFRYKEVHVVNVVPWVDKVMMLVKPFIKKETRKMLHFHASNSETLHDFLPKKHLPEELGGSLPSIEVLKAESVAHIASLRGFFEEDEKNRVNERKRVKGNKREAQTDAPFGHLEID